MKKIAFVFPGQGSQYVGMGKELYDNNKVARDVFELANDALGFSISNLCFNGNQEDLNKTEFTQPAILTTSISILRVLEENGIIPDQVAGLSLGEYSALVCSGAIDFVEAVKLVKRRGKYMQEAVPEGRGGMAAVAGVKIDKIKLICNEVRNKGVVEIANINSLNQIVIAGEVEALNLACDYVKREGGIAKILSVSGPFHTSMLKEAAEKLRYELNITNIEKLNIPIVSNLTGDYYINDADSIRDYLEKQVMNTVLWSKTIQTMIDDGVNLFVELGPNKVLSSMIKKINRSVEVVNVEKNEDILRLKECLSS